MNHFMIRWNSTLENVRKILFVRNRKYFKNYINIYEYISLLSKTPVSLMYKINYDYKGLLESIKKIPFI